jgi:hypothetical protein
MQANDNVGSCTPILQKTRKLVCAFVQLAVGNALGAKNYGNVRRICSPASLLEGLVRQERPVGAGKGLRTTEIGIANGTGNQLQTRDRLSRSGRDLAEDEEKAVETNLGEAPVDVRFPDGKCELNLHVARDVEGKPATIIPNGRERCDQIA